MWRVHQAQPPAAHLSPCLQLTHCQSSSPPTCETDGYAAGVHQTSGQLEGTWMPRGPQGPGWQLCACSFVSCVRSAAVELCAAGVQAGAAAGCAVCLPYLLAGVDLVAAGVEHSRAGGAGDHRVEPQPTSSRTTAPCCSCCCCCNGWCLLSSWWVCACRCWCCDRVWPLLVVLLCW